MLFRSIFLLSLLLVYAVFFIVPPAEGLGYLVRIIYFHIPLAWISVLAFFMSAWWAFQYLRRKNLHYDALSACSARIGFCFVLLASLSGAIFAKLTWGSFWNWDPRQTTIFVLILLYGAYLTLRASVAEPQKCAKVSAVYSLLSCAAVPFLVFIIPRFYFSLHPSPLLNESGRVDMDPVMLSVLLFALLDITLIYFWLIFHKTREGKA